MIKNTRVTKAFYPRSEGRCTIRDNSELRIVYNVYETLVEITNRNQIIVNIVFLHGTGMNKSIWEWYMNYFQEMVEKVDWQLGKMIAIDQVNHGDSAVLNERELGPIFNWLDGSKDVIKICQNEICPFNENTVNIIIGHSMGGHQALGCTVLAPGLFHQAIVLEPVIKMLNISNEQNVTKINVNYYKALKKMTKAEFNSESEYRDFMRNRSFWRKSDQKILEDFCQAEMLPIFGGGVRTKTSQQQHLITYLCLQPSGNWLMENLKWIKSSVTCFVGCNSKWCPPENYEVLSMNIGDFKRIDIPGVDHLMNMETPNVVAPLLLECINSFVMKKECKTPQYRDFSSLYDAIISERVGAGIPKL